jgi:hypothetical protein
VERLAIIHGIERFRRILSFVRRLFYVYSPYPPSPLPGVFWV